MAESSDALTEVKCMMCLTEVLSLPDVRRLPCDHISCLSCLKQNQEIYTTTRCPVCRVEHEVLDFLELELVCERKMTPIAKSFQCGTRNCSTDAILYCPQCKMLFCSLHQKAHNDLMPETHEMMNMLVYTNEMERMAPVLCTDHNLPVAVACKDCFELLCDECDQSQQCPKNPKAKGSHFLKSITHLAAQLKLNFRENFTKLTLLEESMTERRKEILQNFDVMRVENKQLMENLTEVIDNLKTDLDKKKKDIEGNVAAHETNKTGQVQTIKNQTTEFNRECNMAQKLTTKFLSKNDATIIKEHGAYKSRLVELLQSKVPVYPPSTKTLENFGTMLSVTDVGVPEEFSLHKTLRTQFSVSQLAHLESGTVIRRAGSSLYSLEFDIDNIEEIIRYICVYQNSLYILASISEHRRNTVYYTTTAYVISFENPQIRTKLFQQSFDGSKANLDVRQNRALVTDPEAKRIKIFKPDAVEMGLKTKWTHSTDIPLNENTSTVVTALFLSSEEILVCDPTRNSIFSLNMGKETLWKIDTTEDLIGVAVDPINSEFIMLAQKSSGTIRVYSSKGEFIKKIGLPECEEDIRAISLYKNESIAVACGDAVRKYKFIY